MLSLTTLLLDAKAIIKQGVVISANQKADEQQKIIVVAADMDIPPHSKICNSVSRPEDEEFCGRMAGSHE